MGKDPAFLFYLSDFLAETMLLSDEQTGMFIRLLCLQHAHGHLQEKHILSVCKTYDEDVFGKFTKDENGLYYNVRLETDIKKREAYTQSRRINASKAKESENSVGCDKAYAPAYGEAYAGHMGNRNRNVNRNKDASAAPSFDLKNVKQKNIERMMNSGN